jgi:hypothetical protein
MGDLTTLADSIRREGLLQPIGVTDRLELVFGERRLLAHRDILKLAFCKRRPAYGKGVDHRREEVIFQNCTRQQQVAALLAMLCRCITRTPGHV